MKQYGIALHNYHDTNESFPAARSQLLPIDVSPTAPNNSEGNFAGWSTSVMLLPFLEMTSRYQEILVHNGDAGFNILRVNDKTNYAFAMGPISALTCPSDPNGRELCPPFGTSNPEGRRVTQTNLVVSRGEQMFDSENDHGGQPTVAWSTNNTDAINSKLRSMFTRREWKGINVCTDGTSHTVAVSETVTTNVHGSNLVLGGIYVRPNGSSPSMRNSGGNAMCMTMRNGSTLTGTVAKNFSRGASWMFGSAVSNGFHTVNPPNTPNCMWANDGPYSWGLYPPSSYHTGGVNSAFFDGSCRFVSETIDCGTSTAKQVSTGESEYGIWGALGSPNGGESKTL
jgi:prepilin-type processing-associated H-X9-DG protein